MKRVISFVELVDEIPNSAKYLGHQIILVPAGETEEQKSQRIISGGEEFSSTNTSQLRLFFYEVDESDWQQMAAKDWHNKTIPQRINEYLKKYPVKKINDASGL